MKLYLASTADMTYLPNLGNILYALESFYYVKEWQLPYIKGVWKDFLLDSGAFTFLSKGTAAELDIYVRRYIDFINKNDIRKFFEMDVDGVVGLRKVEYYRQLIERETGKKSIPVWHRSRGKQYFLDMVQEYEYVALGGIAIKHIKQSEYRYFPWFIEQAHKHGCKIHGLGFTSSAGLQQYHFDTVDSTSWKSGGRFGQIYQFTGQGIAMTRPKNKRIRDYRAANQFNLNEWIKYQYYLDSGIQNGGNHQ